jgi:hypothetical protein
MPPMSLSVFSGPRHRRGSTRAGCALRPQSIPVPPRSLTHPSISIFSFLRTRSRTRLLISLSLYTVCSLFSHACPLALCSLPLGVCVRPSYQRIGPLRSARSLLKMRVTARRSRNRTRNLSQNSPFPPLPPPSPPPLLPRSKTRGMRAKGRKHQNEGMYKST